MSRAIETMSHTSRRARPRIQPRNGHRPQLPPITLPPVNKVKIAEPGTSDEVLSQKRLKDFNELEQLHLEVNRKYKLELEKLKKAIQQGADVKRGAWKATPKTYLRRSPSYKQALEAAKGKQYVLNVLANTVPHVCYRVTVQE